jgi:hypothetical protein
MFACMIAVQSKGLCCPDIDMLICYTDCRVLSANQSEEQQDASHFCVWLTCRADSDVPDHLLQCLHKISWNHVLSMTKPLPAKPPTPAQTQPVGMIEGQGSQGQGSQAGLKGQGSQAALSGGAGERSRSQGEGSIDSAVASHVTPQKFLREGKQIECNKNR